MNMYGFLAALPALLGLAGFALHQLLGSRGAGDEVTKRIIDKLRRDAPSAVPLDARLKAGQVQDLLKQSQSLQQIVGKQDFMLLQQALRQQFHISLFVYALSIAFCALSVFLFVKQMEGQKQLKLSSFSVVGTGSQADGLPVDHSPVQVSWKSAGDPEDFDLYIENPQTGRRTDATRARSTDNRVQIPPETIRPVLTTRELGKANRLRVVAQAPKEAFTSDPFDLMVGMTVLTIIDDSGEVTVAAMIDNQRVPYYDFEARVRFPGRDPAAKGLVIGPSIPYRFVPTKIKNPRELDFSAPRGVYLGPSDTRLVRFDFLIDNGFVARSASR